MDYLAKLRQDHPTWRIGTVWATANSGPDQRRVYAARDGITLSAWTAAELAAYIRREEAKQASDPPPRRA